MLDSTKPRLCSVHRAESKSWLAQRAESKSGLNTKSDHHLSRRTKSQLWDARDRILIPLGALYQQYLGDTQHLTATTKIGIVQGTIPMGEMYQRYLWCRNRDTNHQWIVVRTANKWWCMEKYEIELWNNVVSWSIGSAHLILIICNYDRTLVQASTAYLLQIITDILSTLLEFSFRLDSQNNGKERLQGKKNGWKWWTVNKSYHV